MSASMSLLLFWGSVILAVLLTRRTLSSFTPDRDFTDTYKGLAMFLVLYHHSRIYHSEFWFLFGGGEAYTGVSMFFFISGFGLFRSQEKKELGTMRFLATRFLALVPGVILCMLLRGAIGPLEGQQFWLEKDPLTLLGLREWFLVAIWACYLAFILSWKTGRTRLERGLCLGAISLLIAAGLAQARSWSSTELTTMAIMWLRFPFSFALGVLLAGQMEAVLDFCRRQALFVLIVTGLTLRLAWYSYTDPSISTIWLADAAIIPFSLAFCSLLYRFGFTSRFWIFLGRNSLYLYLLQVMLLKYGWFTHVWRKDMIGLLACWAFIMALSFFAARVRGLLHAMWARCVERQPA